jgi:hypothetical protein
VPGAPALVDREEKGGYFVEPRDAEQYAPVTMQDLVYLCVPKIRFDVDARNGRGKLAA